MANFDIAYNILRKNEGYYANDPDDLGGETYAGITRRYNPEWSGWNFITMWKSLNPGFKIPNNYNFNNAGLEAQVREFYLAKWNKIYGNQIVSQKVANNFFDFYILAGRAVATMQEVLNGMGATLKVDNIMGPATLLAINQANETELNNRYTAARVAYHEVRVDSGAVSAKFLPGWTARASLFGDGISATVDNAIASVITTVKTLNPIVLALGIGALGTATYFITKPKKA